MSTAKNILINEATNKKRRCSFYGTICRNAQSTGNEMIFLLSEYFLNFIKMK